MSAQLQELDRLPNQRLIESSNGYISLMDYSREEAWGIATDVVDYPVELTTAYYKDWKGDSIRATGRTNTGRDKHFRLVVVDMYRDGDFQAIAAVTNQYGLIRTIDIYKDLREQLEETNKDYDLVGLYVSGDGGYQSLTMEVKGMAAMSDFPDEVAMWLRLCTSVDGTKSHTLSLIAHNKTGDTSAAVYGGEQRLAARHTNTIADRVMDFSPQIRKLIENWNEIIIPTMILMFDNKYDEVMAKMLLDSIADNAGIGQRHRTEIRQLYESDRLRTNDNSHSLYRIQNALTQYVDDELNDKVELQERFKEGIARAINREVNKIKKSR